MALQDQIENLKEELKQKWTQVEESQAYITLKEKYDVLPTRAQKGLQITGALLALYLVLSIPLSNLSLSSEHLEEFNTKRDLLRQLLKASSQDSPSQAAPVDVNFDSLSNRLRGRLQGLNLEESQIGEIQESQEKNNIPLGIKNLEEVGISVQLKMLNLNQVIQAGLELQQAQAGLKMTSLKMEADSKDPHYFHVTYIFKSFSLPQFQETVEDKKSNKKKRS